MQDRATLLETLGGEAGCTQLSREFYARVGGDPTLRRLFPGKSLRCATEAFGAFLIQFLGGDEAQTQRRWWLSLRESHARFRIEPGERSAWLKHMQAALDAVTLDGPAKQALRQFFTCSSAYLIGRQAADPEQEELAARWREQRALDDTLAALAAGCDDKALSLAGRFASRPSVFIGLLARMLQFGRDRLIRFAIDAVQSDPALRTHRFYGRTLLHFACGAGRVEAVDLLLQLGADPNAHDGEGHTPLYRAANECSSDKGPDIVRALVQAGADVNAHGGVTRTSALHMAARRGYVEIARTLLDFGAAIDARDRGGDTPLDRAIKCRRQNVSRLLIERGATATRRSASGQGRRLR